MKIQTQDKLKFAVVGCGHIGKRHAAMIQRNEECTLVALCDIKPRAALQLDNFEAAFFTSIEELLAAPIQIDIVCICTPNAFHAPQGIMVLEAKKHLVCEKPMALSKADCEAMIFKALNVSKQVFCVMQNRYSPPAVWLKSIIDENRLGKIFMVQINCYWNRDDRYYLPHQDATSPAEKRHAWHGSKALDGGTLFTQFSHFIDIMYWLFGDIQDVNAQLADFAHQHSTDFEDSGIVNFQFVNGGMGSINYSTATWDANLESSITIIGEKGSIKVGGQYMNEVEYCHVKDYELPELPASGPANDYGGYKGSAANHHHIIQNVVDVLKGRKTVTTNALEGLKVVEIIERIYRKARWIES